MTDAPRSLRAAARAALHCSDVERFKEALRALLGDDVPTVMDEDKIEARLPGEGLIFYWSPHIAPGGGLRCSDGARCSEHIRTLADLGRFLEDA